MDNQRSLSVDARLERVERVIEQLVDRFNPVVDPAPINWGRWSGRERWPWPDPVVDPVPIDVVRRQLMELLQRNPGWFTDPPPEDFLNVRVLDLLRRFRGGFVDPAPDDLANVRLKDLLATIPGGGITDPNPTDLSRLTLTELESRMHRVKAEMVRLSSFEDLLNKQIEKLKSQRTDT